MHLPVDHSARGGRRGSSPSADWRITDSSKKSCRPCRLKRMQTIFTISVFSAFLWAASGQCFALVSLAEVSVERAKEMGVTIRSNPNGDAGVMVRVEFKTQGELKNFTQVKLEINAGENHLSAPLQTSRPTADTVSVYFSADQGWLDTSLVTVVVKDGERTLIGYQFKVRDFIELENPH